MQEEQETKISSFEEAFAKIKDATGVSNIQVHITIVTMVTMVTIVTMVTMVTLLLYRRWWTGS